MKKYEKIITKYTSKIITKYYKWENITPEFYNKIYFLLLDFYLENKEFDFENYIKNYEKEV